MKQKLGFNIKLNNKEVAVAGLEDAQFGTTICMLDITKRKIDNYGGVQLNVNGLNSDTENHLKWCVKDLVEGDEITIKIVKPPFDKPVVIKSNRKTDEEILEQKLKKYHQLKEELKAFI